MSLAALFNSLDDFEDVREAYVRAPFGYVGGKSRSVANILPHLPYRKGFGEVFGGSGIITWNRKPSPLEFYNDRYSGVATFYRCLHDVEKTKQLIERLEVTCHSREEFIYCRDTWKNVTDDVERAARWYYMIEASFISKGKAFARATNGASFHWHENLKLFWPVHARIRAGRTQIENQDWKQCIKDYDSHDFVFYLDPPYLGTDQGTYEHTFREDKHVELLETVFKSKGFFAISGTENPAYHIYDKYNWTAKYTWEVGCTAKSMAFTESNHQLDRVGDDKREKMIEVLWIKECV